MLGSITSRCSGKETAFLPRRPETRERRKSSLSQCRSERKFSPPDNRAQFMFSQGGLLLVRSLEEIGRKLLLFTLLMAT